MDDHGVIDGNAAAVAELIADQHPDLAGRSISVAGVGWDNVTFRLGSDLTVRAPRRSAGADLILHERRWLPVLLDGVPGRDGGGLDASAHARAGVPGRGYPWHWAIGRWHHGTPAAEAGPVDLDDAADHLGRFLAALHRGAPADAPTNPWRGGPLSGRVPIVHRHLERVVALGRDLGEGIDPDAVVAAVEAAADLPAAGAHDLTWLHGDLHLSNLLVRDGRLSAVIDFGDLCVGDRATDLSIAWQLFGSDGSGRSRFREVAGGIRPISDVTWARARGWAMCLAVAYIQGELTTDSMAAFARRSLRSALRDEAA